MRSSTALATSTQESIEKILPALGWDTAKEKKAANKLIALVVEAAATRARAIEALYPESELGGGIVEAVEEGEQFKLEVMGRSNMLPPPRAAAKAGISRQALDLRRKKGLALALSHAKRGFRYPAWQFTDALAEPLQQILPMLAKYNPWAAYLLLTEPEPLLGGLSVVSTLQSGKAEQAIEAVRTLTQSESA